jgi:hypothetical protein
MSVCATVLGLLAQIDRPEALEDLRRGFQQECSNTHLAVVMAIVALLCAGAVAIWLFRRQPPTDIAPVTHLAKGARVLGLEQEELDDLRTVAGRASVPHPAAMLLSPANLAKAARAAKDAKADPALQERLDRLAQRLYGRSLADCEPPPSDRVS